MYKEIEYIYGDHNSEILTLINPDCFIKTAGISDILEEYVKNLKAKVDKTYALINALSAGEFFSSNRNGDYFSEKELLNSYKTFEEYGHVYKHHINKDPKLSIGKVLFANYNNKMHRVELIVELDNAKAKDVLDQLKKGALVSTSMGCKVESDTCSICGNTAKKRHDYCDHLKYHSNKILLNGKKIYAINNSPKFFDISIVTIPAERTSSIMKVFDVLGESNVFFEKKLASYENSNYIKLAELDTTASINKVIKNKETVIISDNDPKELLNNIKNKNLEDSTIKKLANFSFNEVLSTMLAFRIMPSKKDFQKIALYSTGKEKLADKLDKDGIVFDINTNTIAKIPYDLNIDFYNEKVAELLLDKVYNYSITKELLVTRELLKVAAEWQKEQPNAERSLLSKVLFNYEPDPPLTPEKNPIVPLGILGSLYYGYTKVFNNPSTSGFKNLIAKNPWLLPILIGGASVGSIVAQNNEFNKTAGSVDKFMRNSLISFPTTYYLAGSYENELKKGNSISSTKNFIRKHPGLISLVTSIAGVKAENVLKKLANFVSKLPEEKLNEYYSELISGKELASTRRRIK